MVIKQGLLISVLLIFAMVVGESAAHTSVISMVQPSDSRAASTEKGNEDTRFNIVMYGDFYCPYCRKALTSLRRLNTESPTLFTLEHKFFPPSIEDNHYLAKAAICMQKLSSEAQYLAFINALSSLPIFANINAKKRAQFALSKASTKPEQLDLCLKSKLTVQRLAEDILQAKTHQFSGTPGFVVIDKKSNKMYTYQGAAIVEYLEKIAD